jgi:hypothetical protein
MDSHAQFRECMKGQTEEIRKAEDMIRYYKAMIKYHRAMRRRMRVYYVRSRKYDKLMVQRLERVRLGLPLGELPALPVMPVAPECPT